ncbi:MAG: hypothetical protein AB8B56_08385 [Crocinitomicaceae bacterium]
MKRIYLLLFVLIGTFNLSACDCVDLSMEEDYANHTNVFKGKIISVDLADDSSYGSIVTIQVITNFKGKTAETVSIRTGLGGPDCGFRFEEGREYVIFASLGTMYSSGYDDKLLEVTYCSNTGLFADKASEMRALNGLFWDER